MIIICMKRNGCIVIFNQRVREDLPKAQDNPNAICFLICYAHEYKIRNKLTKLTIYKNDEVMMEMRPQDIVPQDYSVKLTTLGCQTIQL